MPVDDEPRMRRISDPTDFAVMRATVQQMRDEQIRLGERMSTVARDVAEIKANQSTFLTSSGPVALEVAMHTKQIQRLEHDSNNFRVEYTRFTTDIITTVRNTRWLLGTVIAVVGIVIAGLQVYAVMHAKV